MVPFPESMSPLDNTRRELSPIKNLPSNNGIDSCPFIVILLFVKLLALNESSFENNIIQL